ncbi:MAG: hypothetical protein M3R08_06110 [Bacteroidota bacterium]|nr:hypothetical protein [Bacteroidota bacterium]
MAVGFYLALISGILIMLIGVYLMLIEETASGITLAGRAGKGGGEPASIPGWGFILIGALVALPASMHFFSEKRKGPK